MGQLCTYVKLLAFQTSEILVKALYLCQIIGFQNASGNTNYKKAALYLCQIIGFQNLK